MSKNILSAITQGIYKSYSLTLYDKNNNPLDLTGKTVYFTIKEDIDDLDSKAILQKIFLIETPNPINFLNLTINTQESLDLPAGSYPYDIKISFTGFQKEIQSGFQGVISINKSVTKDALR